MGTRGLYCVVQDDEIKVAQYGQWDAYPSGQGFVVLDFLQTKVSEGSLDQFRDRVKALRQMSSEEVQAIWDANGADGSGLVSMDIAKRVKENHPQFSRDTCGAIMEMIDDGRATEVHLQDSFAADSLFCEWAYVINLDENVLEVYKGFQEAAHNKGRFADYEVEERQQGKYWPVAEVSRFAFDSLPDHEAFEAICEGNVLDRLAHLEHEPQG